MALADFQASFNGLTIGPGTSYDIFSVEGIDDWGVRSNDQTLPNLWGAQAGGDFVEPRTIILGVQMTSSLGVSAPLETAFVPSAQAAPTALQPLVFKLPDRQEVQVQCRVRRRGRARTPETEVSMVRWLFEIAAPDPRLYASTSTVTVMTPYAADTTALDLTAGSGTGLAFDLTVSSGTGLAFDFTGVAGSGSVAIANAGNVDTYPSFTFATTAAMASWHVINDTTGETASFAYALVPGHTVVADMAGVATGSTVLPVTLDGASNYPIWVSPRVPVRLVPGTNILRFFVDSGTAPGSTCTVTMRSAWL
jgi:hypothetical protein